MPRPQPRLVCLVPSLTETLIDLGATDRLVGRTRYCVEPAGTVERIEAVGGTKNPDVERIVALAPDLVVVNKEENRIEDWEVLVAAGLDVMVTHPRTVAEAADMIDELGERADVAAAGKELGHKCRDALARATERTAGRPAVRAFCPIWRNPWMTFRRTTYIGDVLAVVGFDNIFGAHGESADFFEIDVAEALAREPEIIVLPDEPYVFGRKHGEELRTRGAKAQIFYVDGKDLCWYGPRVPRALMRLLKITDVISRI